METTKDTVRVLRVRAGFRSQAAVAALAKVKVRTYSDVEAGKGSRSTTLRKIAPVLGVSPGQLLDASIAEEELRARLRKARRAEPLMRSRGRKGVA